MQKIKKVRDWGTLNVWRPDVLKSWEMAKRWQNQACINRSIK